VVGFEGTAGFGFAGRVGHRRRPFYRIRRAAEGRAFPVLKFLYPHPPPPWGVASGSFCSHVLVP
jgi:hypothetical protein